jgi:cytochrome c oxidase cbb3-type subunit I/II
MRPIAHSSKDNRGSMTRSVKRLAEVLMIAGVLLLGLTLFGSFSTESRAQIGDAPLFSWSQFISPPAPRSSQTLNARGKDLYAWNCSTCHGMEGKGDGWRSAFLYPKPRNFTRGIFRFKMTESGSLPTNGDLFRTISMGLQGTAMPTWGYYLSEEDRWALVAYIKTLSPYFREEAAGTPIALGTVPELSAARVARGKALYARVGCMDCHGEQGYGDGFAAKDMLDSFGVPIRPRNFHIVGEFKRGRTLRDIALTIHTGNDGTPMPSFHKALTPAQVWDLASYVITLDIETPTFGGRGCPMRMTRMQMPAVSPAPAVKAE